MIKTKITRVLAIIIITIFAMSFAKCSSLAASFSVSPSSTNVKVGESFTVNINASGMTGRFDISVSNGTSNISKVWVENGKQEETIKITTKSAGTTKVTITANNVANSSRDEVTGSTSCSVSVKSLDTNKPSLPNDENDDKLPTETKPSTNTSNKSSNNYLKSLTVDNGKLTPEFNSRTYKYNVEVGKEIEKIVIKSSAEHDKAKVSGTGTKTLKSGENNFNIKVTAEDGKVRTYTILVNRITEEAKLKLDNLKIQAVKEDGNSEEIKLTPEFNPDVYEYHVEVNNDIKNLDIEALVTQEGLIVEITGNENLVSGENIITILVKSEDGKSESTYKIIVNKEEKAIEALANLKTVENDNTKNPIWTKTQAILIVVFTSVIAIAGIVFAVIEYRYKREDNKEIGQIPFSKIGFEKEIEEKNDLLKNENEKIINKEEKVKNKKESSFDILEEDILKKKKGKHF